MVQAAREVTPKVCVECGRDLPDGPPCPHCERTVGGSGDARSGRQEEIATYNNEPTRTEQFLPGAKFAGRYRIVHRLGKGGMAEVYRAEDMRLGQTIALKFLLQSSRGDIRALERFRDEARLARQVSHSGVCRIFDYGRSEGMTYVAMEHVEGETLASLRRRIGRPPPERSLEIAVEICRGLGAIHEQGILHRDLKPANVMLDGRGRARILDFGLAAMADAISGADVRSGTPAYMAPEQACGEGVSVRSDLYSLGLVLRELWTGERLRKRDRHDPAPISSRVERVSPAVDRIVSRCLRVTPERRPASAESVLGGLQRAAAFEPGPILRTVVAFDPPSLPAEHSERVADLLESFGGQEVWDTESSLWLFDRPRDAVSFVVAYRTLAEEAEDSDRVRLGLEVTEVVLRARLTGEPGSGAIALDGAAAPMARSLVALALPGQTLLSGLACHLARKAGRTVDGGEGLSWLSHGRYRLSGHEEPVEVFEVGVEGLAPLAAPASSEAGQLALDGSMVTGWRPAPGVSIPQRPNFQIERRLGEGGFGDVWLALHRKTGERRVFKFCFDASQLHGLRREITLFRLLKEELGDRDDIARVLDWNLDHAPFFIESQYTVGGDLAEWAEEQGGADKVPLEERLELVAQVADALAAAHLVGVLHKDVKPGNILITIDSEGGFKARLADFGVGRVTDTERLEAAGITIAGWTTLGSEEDGDSASGTRLYLAPEVLEGRPPTLLADIYALGVVLYQLVTGHLGRAVAPGWRNAIDDPLLVEDIAAALNGDPSGRLQSAQKLAKRLRTLEERRAEARQAALRQRKEEERQRLLEQAAQRRKIYLVLLIIAYAVTTTFLWRQAIDERAQAEHERRRAEQISSFLTDTFSAAEPDPARGDVTVRENLELAETRLADNPELAPEDRADMMGTLSFIYGGLGIYDRAIELGEETVRLLHETHPAGHREVARAINNLAALLYREQRYEAAEEKFRESLEMKRRLGLTDSEIATNVFNLASTLIQLGQYDKAERSYLQLLEIEERLGGQESLRAAASLYGLGTIKSYHGEFDQAEPLLRRALAIRLQGLDSEHPRVADILNTLGRVLLAKGRLEEAEACYRRSLNIRIKRYGNNHIRVARSKTGLAAVLLARGDVESAGREIAEALEIFPQPEPGSKDSFSAADAKGVWGDYLAAVGRYAEAESILLESYRIIRDHHGDESAFTQKARRRLVELYESWGKPAKLQDLSEPP